jgi:hypothetical protein
VLEAQKYRVIEHDQSGVNGFSYGLGEKDQVRLFDAEGKQVDLVEWSAEQVLEDQSLGRKPNGTGELQAMKPPTKGAAN